jgi:hypothetical protein
MKYFLYILLSIFIYGAASAQPTRVVIIRHGEKSAKGDNLSCQGLNRSLQLPKVLNAKFGVPSITYVPALNPGKSTTHVRMFQTISPFVIKYDLSVNSNYDVDNYSGLAANIQKKTGTVLVVWEHKAMDNILSELGVKSKDVVKWGDDDYDSIWIVTYKNGKAKLTIDKEGLTPSTGCPI